jgi:hypothetical protein
MTFYEFSIYGKKRSHLRDVADTLVKVWDFDPTSVRIERSWKTPVEQVLRTLRLLLGVRDAGDWHLAITGPKLRKNEVQLRNLVEHYGGYTEDGGYNFDYNPTANYTDVQINAYRLAWSTDRDGLRQEYLASLSPSERARYRAAEAELGRARDLEVARARAYQDRYGYAE